MKELLMQIIKLSLSAALIAGLVMLLRLALKKSPRFIICALWALVAVRLLVPVLPESRVSMMPRSVSSGTMVEDIAARPLEPTVRVTRSEPSYVKIIEKNPTLPVRYQGGEAYVEVSKNTLEAPKTIGKDIFPILAWVWLGGLGVMLAYMAFSYFRIWRKVRISAKEQDNIYLCDAIRSPFILGIIRPKIYLPSDLKEKDRAYVLAHEQAHLKRLDHVWKPLGYLLLSVHWFNPVMWAAYILLCRDIEVACDEKVTAREGAGYKKAYSEALLASSMPARLVTACPLAFGEVGVKTRIKNVLHYKKPAFWVLLLTAVACLTAAGCALTNRASTAPSEDPPAVTTQEPSTVPAPESTAPVPESTPAPKESTSAVTRPTETAPSQTPASETEIRVDQEGMLQAGRVAYWPAVFEGYSLYSPDGKGPESFVFRQQYRQTLLLDRAGKRILEAQQEGPVRSYSLEGCEDPRLITDLKVLNQGGEETVYAVLDKEAVFFFSLDWKLGLTQRDVLKLPEGLSGDDVLYMEAYPQAEASDALLLRTEEKSYINREGSAEWTLYTENGGFPPELESAIFARTAPDGFTTTIYEESDGYMYASPVDKSDWRYEAVGQTQMEDHKVYVMAPRMDGISLYEVEVGVNRINALQEVESVGQEKQDLILQGGIVPLNGGHPIDEKYAGFSANLDGLAGSETVTLETGVGNHHVKALEFYVNGQPAGTSLMRYHGYELGLGSHELLLPDEATFNREKEYRLYLASLDGIRATLFLESEEETYGLSLQQLRDVNGIHIVLRTRLRGPGKAMADFIPCQSLEKYMEEGWLVRPEDGDELDATGDGKKNIIRVALGGEILTPYMEWVAVDEIKYNADLAIVYNGFDNAFAKEEGLTLRYGDLYYAANDQGGIDLIGELSLNGRTLVQRYQLADGERRPLMKGDDFTGAAYWNMGGMPRPYPGWAGVETKVETYYVKRKGERAALSRGELYQLDQLFKSLFAGHFLLSEYEDIRDVNLQTLFFDGAEDSPVVRAAYIPEEERAAVIAAMGTDGFGLAARKLTRQEAEAEFLRYTGLELSEMGSPEELSASLGFYVPQYDAWYTFKGDTADRGYSIADAFINADGFVTALWRGLGWEKDAYGLVTLEKTAAGWQIRSNEFLTEEKLAKADKEEEAYRTIVLFGVDARNMTDLLNNSQGDVCILISIHKETGEIRMASLSRDLLYEYARGQFCKLTDAYSRYGAEQVMAGLNRSLDLNISDYLVLSWNAVADVVDSLGGIDIELASSEEADEMRNYLFETMQVTGREKTREIDSAAGVQHLDGVHAVAYLRIRRPLVGLDYDRPIRQQKIMTAVSDGIREMIREGRTYQVLQMLELIRASSRSSMEPLELNEFALDILPYSNKESIGFPLTAASDPTGVWACSGSYSEDVKELHRFLYELEEYEPSENVRRIEEYHNKWIKTGGR